MTTSASLGFKTPRTNIRSHLGHSARHLTRSFFALTHNGFAVLGLVLALAVITLQTRPDWRAAGEGELMGWLQSRQDVAGDLSEFYAVESGTATNPKNLPTQQAALTFWLSKKYRVAPEPVGALVVKAFELGKQVKLEPTLILAIMAIESGFNPFAQSSVGAQGLMQVMTHVHKDKYGDFGGKLAAFDPVANLRVGVRILQECITKAGGSLEGGLKFYVGATNRNGDGGYADKVMSEHSRLQAVAGNKPLSPAPALAAAGKVPFVGAQKVAWSEF